MSVRDEVGNKIGKVSKWGKIIGVVLVILGVLSIVAPMASGFALMAMIGGIMTVAGVGRLMWAFQAGSFGKGVLAFLLGALFIVTGILMITQPMTGLASLALVLAAFFVVDGIFEIVAGFKVKPEAGWGWLVFGGIVSVVLGGLIWSQWPLSGAWAIGVLVGIKLIFAGMAVLRLGSLGGRVAKRLTGEA